MEAVANPDRQDKKGRYDRYDRCGRYGGYDALKTASHVVRLDDFACGTGHADIAELLVREGCDTARRDKHGRTGRDHAEQFGFGALVERLDRLRVT